MRHVALAYGSDALRNKWGVGGYGVPTPIAKWCLAAEPNGDAFAVAKRLLTITNHCEQMLRR